MAVFKLEAVDVPLAELAVRVAAGPPVVAGLQAEQSLFQAGIDGGDHQVAPAHPAHTALLAQWEVVERRVRVLELWDQTQIPCGVVAQLVELPHHARIAGLGHLDGRSTGESSA